MLAGEQSSQISVIHFCPVFAFKQTVDSNVLNGSLQLQLREGFMMMK